MSFSLKIVAICLASMSLTSCQQGMSCNKWTEKDCYYSDYYQTPPVSVPDRNYYQSDSVR